MTTMNAARNAHRLAMHERKLTTKTGEDGEEVRVMVIDTTKRVHGYMPFRAWARAEGSRFTKPLSPKLKEIIE